MSTVESHFVPYTRSRSRPPYLVTVPTVQPYYHCPCSVLDNVQEISMCLCMRLSQSVDFTTSASRS